MIKRRYYVAFPGEIESVTVVHRGLGDYNVKRKTKSPVRVRQDKDGDEFFVDESELFDNPIAAGIHADALERKHR